MAPLDEGLLARARSGDPDAFRAVMEALGPQLIAFITFLLRQGGAVAHDLVQDVFVEAWRQLPRFDTVEHLRAWCYRVARCRAASHGRRERRQHSRARMGLQEGARQVPLRSVRVVEPSAPDPHPLLGALNRALDLLPRCYRAPVRLHYYQGLDTPATAEVLGITVSAAKMRLWRARLALRRLIAAECPAARAPAAPRKPSVALACAAPRAAAPGAVGKPR